MYMKPEMFFLLKPIEVFFIFCETEIVESLMYHTQSVEQFYTDVLKEKINNVHETRDVFPFKTNKSFLHFL